MPCGFFHKKVNKVWVFKPLLTKPTLSDWVFIMPANRNYYVYSPFSATVERITSGISSWKNITFSNGITIRMNNRFELNVGDTVNVGDVIGAAGPMSCSGIDEGAIFNGLAFPDLFGVSGSGIAEFIGEEIQSVPNDSYMCIDCTCSGEKSIIIFHSLTLSTGNTSVLRVANVGDELQAPEMPAVANAKFLGWYIGRKYQKEYTGIVEESGIIFVWAKWDIDKPFSSGYVTISQSENVLPANSIESQTYKVFRSGSSVPWMIDEEEANSIYGDDILCIGSYVEERTSFSRPRQYDAEGFYVVTYGKEHNYRIRPFVVCTKSIPKDGNIGMFFSPIGTQVMEGKEKGVPFEQTLYSGDVSWYVEGGKTSNTVDPGGMNTVYNLVPSYLNRIYMYAYAYGGTPSFDYIPSIIPILLAFSSRVTGLPSINMFSKHIVK